MENKGVTLSKFVTTIISEDSNSWEYLGIFFVLYLESKYSQISLLTIIKSTLISIGLV